MSISNSWTGPSPQSSSLTFPIHFLEWWSMHCTSGCSTVIAFPSLSTVGSPMEKPSGHWSAAAYVLSFLTSRTTMLSTLFNLSTKPIFRANCSGQHIGKSCLGARRVDIVFSQSRIQNLKLRRIATTQSGRSSFFY